MTIAKTASELLAEYRMLSPLEQTTLQLLAFFIAPVTRTGVHEMLKKLNISVNNRQINYSDVSAVLSTLLKSGMLEEPRGGVSCVAQLQQPLIREVVREGNLPLYAETVRPYLSIVPSYYERYHYGSYAQALQNVRLALYCHDEQELGNNLKACYQYFNWDSRQRPPLFIFFPEPLDTEWLSTFPPGLLTSILDELSVIPGVSSTSLNNSSYLFVGSYK